MVTIQQHPTWARSDRFAYRCIEVGAYLPNRSAYAHVEHCLTVTVLRNGQYYDLALIVTDNAIINAAAVHALGILDIALPPCCLFEYSHHKDDGVVKTSVYGVVVFVMALGIHGLYTIKNTSPRSLAALAYLYTYVLT